MFKEGTKSLRHALGRPHGMRWTALKVFNANNRKLIKREIERKYPEVKKPGGGHFKYWPEVKAKCFNALTADEKQTYQDLAENWNYFGTTPAEKAA